MTSKDPVIWPRITKLPEDNDYDGLWRIETRFSQWKPTIELLLDAYPHGIELFAPPTQIEAKLADFYYCREQVQRQVENNWNNVGTSSVIILKSDSQMTYFNMVFSSDD